MSKIIILVLANLIGTGLAQDISAAICATPGDYDGSDELHTNPVTTKKTCDQIAAHFGLSSTTKQCTDVIPDGKARTLKQATNLMATLSGCCGSSGKSACWEDISAAVCLTPSDYDGSHEFDYSGQKMTCDTLVASAGISATNQCASMEQSINALATTYGCCGSSGKSACWEDISAAVCFTPSDYDGSHEFDYSNGQKMTCDQLAAQSGITATKQCSATVKDGGYSSMKQTTNSMATIRGCCGSAAKSACWVDVSAAICATPSNYDGAHEYGLPGSSSSQKVKCDAVMSQVTLTSTDATCDSAPGPMQGGQPGPSKDYITTILASVYGCCGVGGKSPCSVDTAIAGAVCENAGDFKPDYDVGQGITCLMTAIMPQITENDGTKKDCAIVADSVMGMATMGCCGPARKSACGVAPATPGANVTANVTADASTDANAANTLQSVSWSVVATLVGLIALM